MHALQLWNGGVILISHDERFITKVASEVSIFLDVYLCNVKSDYFALALGVWRWNGDQVLWRR